MAKLWGTGGAHVPENPFTKEAMKLAVAREALSLGDRVETLELKLAAAEKHISDLLMAKHYHL